MVKLAGQGQQGELNMLLKNKADPNVIVNVEWRDFLTSPLLEAAVSGHARVARMLLSAGADPNQAVGPAKFTAVYNASFNGHAEVVKILVAHGAEVNCVTEDGFSPLYISAQEGHAACVRALLSSDSIEVNHARPDEGATALYIAAQHGRAECVEALLATKRLDIDLPMHDGSTCVCTHPRVLHDRARIRPASNCKACECTTTHRRVFPYIPQCGVLGTGR